MGPIKELKEKNTNFKELCQKLMNQVFPDNKQSDVLFGNTKIYLKLDFESKWDAKRFEIVKAQIEFAVSKVAAIYKGIKVRLMVKNWKKGAKLFVRAWDIRVKAKLFSSFN